MRVACLTNLVPHRFSRLSVSRWSFAFGCLSLITGKVTNRLLRFSSSGSAGLSGDCREIYLSPIPHQNSGHLFMQPPQALAVRHSPTAATSRVFLFCSHSWMPPDYLLLALSAAMEWRDQSRFHKLLNYESCRLGIFFCIYTFLLPVAVSM